MPYPTADQERQTRNMETAENYNPWQKDQDAWERTHRDMTPEEIAEQNFCAAKCKYLRDTNEDSLAHLVLQYTQDDGNYHELAGIVSIDEDLGAEIVEILARHAATDLQCANILKQLSMQYALYVIDEEIRLSKTQNPKNP